MEQEKYTIYNNFNKRKHFIGLHSKLPMAPYVGDMLVVTLAMSLCLINFRFIIILVVVVIIIIIIILP